MKRKIEVQRDTEIQFGSGEFRFTLEVNDGVMASQSPYWADFMAKDFKTEDMLALPMDILVNSDTQKAATLMLNHLHQSYKVFDVPAFQNVWSEVLRLNSVWEFPDETFLNRTATLGLDWQTCVTLLEDHPTQMEKVWSSLDLDFEWDELYELKCSPCALLRTLLQYQKDNEETVATIYLLKHADHRPQDMEKSLLQKLLNVNSMWGPYVHFLLIPIMERNRHLYQYYTGDLSKALQTQFCDISVTIHVTVKAMAFLVGIPLELIHKGDVLTAQPKWILDRLLCQKHFCVSVDDQETTHCQVTDLFNGAQKFEFDSGGQETVEVKLRIE